MPRRSSVAAWLALLVPVCVAGVEAQVPDAWEAHVYQQQEFMRYIRGLSRVQIDFNPYDSRSNVARTYRALVGYTGGRQYAVVPAQTGTIGQAHNG